MGEQRTTPNLVFFERKGTILAIAQIVRVEEVTLPDRGYPL